MRLLTTTLFFIINTAVAQKQTGYVVKVGEVPANVIPAEALYAFPKFIQGTIYLRDGSVSVARVNYNIMLDEMQFIGNKGDTLAIAYPETIKKIVVKHDEYYYDKTYLRIISATDSFKLAAKEFYVQSPYRTRGGYDAPTGAGAITTYGSINSSRSTANLQVQKDVRFDRHIVYFIADRFGRFFTATKKSFTNIFPNKKAAIEDFISKNSINFSNRGDLEKLLKFAAAPS